MENLLQITALHHDLSDQPWRQPSVWDKKLEKTLKIEIKRLHSSSVQNVLIVGPIGAGKNSFIKSAINIFQQFKYSFSMDAADDLPKRPRFAEDLRGDTVFCLSDQTYIEDEINIVGSELVVKRSVKKRYLFSQDGTFPEYSQKIHCVIFIVSAKDVIDDVTKNEQIKLLRQKLRTIRIPVALVLTKVDILCEEVGKDTTKMFRSTKVLEVIKKASEIFEIKEASIHPVVNNVNDSKMRTEIHIPLLLALKKTLECASRYLHDCKNERRDLPTQTPMGGKLTTESMSPEYSSAFHRVKKLLSERNLPKNDDLQSIYKDQGRKYKPLKEICEDICNIIKTKLYNDAVKNIWPARKLANENVVFVVELVKEVAVHPTYQHDLEILIDYGVATRKKERIEIITKERDFLINKTDEYRNKLERLQPILMRHSKQLMEKHKNITAILPCVIKSVGYGTQNRHLLETVCISIHVKRKIRGLIPLDEEAISIMVEDIKTDVVQGECRLLSNGPHDYHRNLKMGLAIRAQTGGGGTLGCFVQHNTYGMCCITNAHVVLKESELQHLLRCGYMEYETNNGKSVFQPIYSETEPFGKVVAAAGYEGNAYKSGSEVALIQILNRLPLSGSFPHSTPESAPKFEFNTGSVTALNWQDIGKKVFKFGMVTGPTIGFLMSYGASIRYNESIQLHQQIEVIPPKGESFAASGDSGSSVFVEFHQPGRESVIGLISAGEDEGERIFVTPIHEILQSLNCQPSLHRFENIDDNGTKVSTANHCAGAEETINSNN